MPNTRLISNIVVYLFSGISILLIIFFTTSIIISKLKKQNNMSINNQTVVLEEMELATKNLSAMEDFYKNYVGLKEVKPRESNTVYLGDNRMVLIKLS